MMEFNYEAHPSWEQYDIPVLDGETLHPDAVAFNQFQKTQADEVKADRTIWDATKDFGKDALDFLAVLPPVGANIPGGLMHAAGEFPVMFNAAGNYVNNLRVGRGADPIRTLTKQMVGVGDQAQLTRKVGQYGYAPGPMNAGVRLDKVFDNAETAANWNHHVNNSKLRPTPYKPPHVREEFGDLPLNMETHNNALLNARGNPHGTTRIFRSAEPGTDNVIKGGEWTATGTNYPAAWSKFKQSDISITPNISEKWRPGALNITSKDVPNNQLYHGVSPYSMEIDGVTKHIPSVDASGMNLGIGYQPNMTSKQVKDMMSGKMLRNYNKNVKSGQMSLVPNKVQGPQLKTIFDPIKEKRFIGKQSGITPDMDVNLYKDWAKGE